MFWLILFVTYRRIRKKDGSVRTKTYLYRACWLMLIPFLYLTFFFEEMWIDKSFYKACSVGGRFIYKTVQAEGYIDIDDQGKSYFYFPIEQYPAPSEPLDAVNSRNYAIPAEQQWEKRSGTPNTEKRASSNSFFKDFLFYEYGYGEIKTDKNKGTYSVVNHYEWHDGEWQSTKLAKPVARYQYRQESWGIVGWGVLGRRRYILDSQTGEALADHIDFYRGGNYWKRHTIGLLGSIDQPCATDKRFRDTKQYDNFNDLIAHEVIKPF